VLVGALVILWLFFFFDFSEQAQDSKFKIQLVSSFLTIAVDNKKGSRVQGFRKKVGLVTYDESSGQLANRKSSLSLRSHEASCKSKIVNSFVIRHSSFFGP
jgi:hypothetical protein